MTNIIKTKTKRKGIKGGTKKEDKEDKEGKKKNTVNIKRRIYYKTHLL